MTVPFTEDGRRFGRRPLASRHVGSELLDGDDLDRDDLRINLRELARLNRLPGGTGASLAAVCALVDGQRALALLDVGTGGGDVPAAFAAHARATGQQWRVVALDSRPEIVAIAAARLRGTGVTVQAGDARTLPFDDGSVDVVHASLLMHHLDPDAALGALREMRRVAGRGVVINDLRRGVLPFLVTTAVVVSLTRGRYTRHDGPLSVRRAYTLAELDDLAAQAGMRPTWRSSRLLPRVATVYR